MPDKIKFALCKTLTKILIKKKTKKQKKRQLTMASFYFKGAQNPWLIDNQNKLSRVRLRQKKPICMYIVHNEFFFTLYCLKKNVSFMSGGRIKNEHTKRF